MKLSGLVATMSLVLEMLLGCLSDSCTQTQLGMWMCPILNAAADDRE